MPLSQKQLAVAMCIKEAFNIKETAVKTGLSVLAVRHHRKAVLMKTGARTAAQLCVWMNWEIFRAGLEVWSR